MSSNIEAAILREKLTIFQVLEALGVDLPQGHNTQQIVCPFHDDNTPSARIYAESNRLFCFTCHKLWDVFSLVQDKRNIQFDEAVKWLESIFKMDARGSLPVVVRSIPKKRKPEEFASSTLEDYIQSYRFELGYTNFSRAFLALDHLDFFLKKKQITTDQYVTEIHKIMKFVEDKVNETKKSHMLEV